MLVDDFTFELPDELIAQYPSDKRDDSRLLVLDRDGDQAVVSHRQFTDIVEYLNPGDLLVINDTKVFPARLLGNKESGGKIEVMLVSRLHGDDEVWDCMLKSSKPVRPGVLLNFGDRLRAEVVSPRNENSLVKICFTCEGDFLQTIEEIGHIPLPPYIKRQDEVDDKGRYQTIYANEAGALAAPTAGLHFTEEVLSAIRARGCEIAPVTLHVGLGTFLPVRVDQVVDHAMHKEIYSVSESTVQLINQTKRSGGRVVAVGTTSVRTLESAATSLYSGGLDGEVVAGSGETDIFIYPGYAFKVVDALITNFHLPKSTLLMLISAFSTKEKILDSYRQAVQQRYRFFSYGDCMFIK